MSSTDIEANSSRFSGTRLRPPSTRSSIGVRPSGRPSNVTPPLDGSTPMIAFRRLVLPAPLAPITVATPPIGMAIEAARTASTRP